MEEKLSVLEISERFNVTRQAVYNWLAAGLPYETERVIGKKARKVINPNDVPKFLKLTER